MHRIRHSPHSNVVNVGCAKGEDQGVGGRLAILGRGKGQDQLAVTLVDPEVEERALALVELAVDDRLGGLLA